MRTLVTGGAGFIGSNLVDAVLEQGDEVTIVDNLSTGRRANLEGALAKGARLVEADMRDGDAMRDLCADWQPEVVFHLGAQIDVRRSVADPAYDAGINILGTINMLAAAQASGARRFVNSSTGGAIYGEGRVVPAPETHSQAPEAAYGQSKLAAEGYCELFRRLHGFSTVSLRYGNVYGPRQDPLGEAGVIAIFCGKLLEGGQPLVYGDGLQTRDYVYVGDVAEAFFAASRTEIPGVWNIGTGRETSVLELIEVVGKAASRGISPDFAAARPGEVLRSALVADRARSDLGWTPRTDLTVGVGEVYRWIEANSPDRAGR
jgi:UDP-glucose 4-epimerase